jgi:prepilin-type N-terminal cleavage/methylation domain
MPYPTAHSPARLRSSPAAFTLIELLTVIAIVGILIAILVPVVSHVRASAKRTRCTANIRSLGTAFNLFAADNKGYYPAVIYHTSYTDGRVNPGKSHWWLELRPYIGNANIKDLGAIPESPFGVCPIGQIGMNSKVSYYYQFRPNTIGRPTKIILLGDSKDHVLTVWNESTEHAAPKRHNGKANYLFFDGHVESLDPAAGHTAFNRDPFN